MIQFATPINDNSAENTVLLVREALQEGCRWIRLRSILPPGQLDDIAELCRKEDAILVIDNDIEAVERIRCHGLHLPRWERRDVIAARERLGAHAIVGVTCSKPERLPELKGLDVDYIVAYPHASEDVMDFCRRYMEQYRAIRTELTDGMVANMTAHPVAGGDISPEHYDAVLSTGFEGIETDSLQAICLKSKA